VVSTQSEHAQRDGLAALRVLYEHNPEGVLFTLPDEGRVLAANPAACAILGMSEDEIRRRGRHGILELDGARVSTGVESLLRTGQVSGQTRMRRGDGRVIETEVSVNTFAGRDGATWGCTTFRDVSHLFEAERELDALSAQLEDLRVGDELTGLSNRRGLILTGTELLRQADALALEVQVLFVDVQGLAGLNERRGQEAGDAALRAVARALREAFRRSDAVARIGSALFAVIALDLHESQRDGVEERMSRRLSDQQTLAFVGEPVDLALGWTTRHPGDTTAIEDLVDQSDRARRTTRPG
jgi:diguanylate cyclase (GGDEF)-like protein/PAS domain S-box-containing protein